jgi:hypothetical protein
MTVPTPAVKTIVIATICVRRLNVEAKYAGSITEMQQGARSARIPPTNEASTVEVMSRSLMCSFRGSAGLTAVDAGIPTIVYYRLSYTFS